MGFLVRFAISIPQFYADGEFDRAPFAAYLARAEELGLAADVAGIVKAI